MEESKGNSSQQIEILNHYYIKVSDFLNQECFKTLFPTSQSENPKLYGEIACYRLKKNASKLSSSSSEDLLQIKLIDIEILIQRVRAFYKKTKEETFIAELVQDMEVGKRQELLQRVKMLKEQARLLNEEAKILFKGSINFKELTKIQEGLEQGKDSGLSVAIEEQLAYYKGTNREFGIFLMDNFLVVGNQTRDADVLSTQTMEEVATLNILHRGFVTASYTDLYLIIGVAQGSDCFVFNKDSFQAISTINIVRAPLHMLKLSDSLLFMSQLNHLTIFKTGPQTLGQLIPCPDPTNRFIFATQTRKQNEIALGCASGLKFCTYDINNSMIALSEEVYMEGCVVQGIEEYERNKLFLAVYNKLSYVLVDRNLRQVTKEIPNPFSNSMQFNLRLLPLHLSKKDGSTRVPFGIIRDQKQITLIDYNKMQFYKLAESPYRQDNWCYVQFYCQRSQENRLICYCLEEGGQHQVRKIKFKKELTQALKNIFNTGQESHMLTKTGLVLDNLSLNFPKFIDLTETLKKIVKHETGMKILAETEFGNEVQKFQDYFKKYFSSLFNPVEEDLHLHSNGVLETMHQSILQQYMQRLTQSLKYFEECMKRVNFNLQRKGGIPFETDQLRELAESIYNRKQLQAQQQDESNLIVENQVYSNSRQFEYSVFSTDKYVLAPNETGDVDVLLKSGFSIVGNLDLQGKQLITACLNEDFVYIGMNSGNKILAFDLATFTNIGSITAARSALYVLKINDIYFLNCELGHLELVNMIEMKIDIQLEAPGKRFLYASKSSKRDEVILGCETGLFFAYIDYNIMTIILSKESYLQGKIIQGAIEYKDHFICAAIYICNYLAIVDRKRKQVVRRVHNPTSNFMQLNLFRIPGFSSKKSPFLLMRTQRQFVIIDLVNFRVLNLIDACYQSDNWTYHQVCAELNENKEVVLYSNEISDSMVVKKIILRKEFVPMLHELKKM